MPTTIEQTCKHCGTSFQVRTLYIKQGRGLFCSRKCAWEYQTRELSRQWKGGRHIDDHGYVRVYDKNGKYHREHRVVMEQLLSRPLKRSEAIHHKNGDKTDNRPENLELMTIGGHVQQHNYEREYHKIDRWARSYDCCVVCGTTNAKHHCKGRCKPCHDHHIRSK